MDKKMLWLFALTLVMAGLFGQALLSIGNRGMVQGCCLLFMLVGVVLVSSVESGKPSRRLTKARALVRRGRT